MLISKKVLLVGWDAADWKIITELIDQDRMPTVKRLVENGVMGKMRTLTPVLSPMLWTSIATGKRPFKHGIYGFVEPAPDGKRIQPITNVSRKCKAIWNILTLQNKRSIVVGWWPSHPAEPINGVMVSDWFNKAPDKPTDVWRLRPNTVHPKSLAEPLAEFRVHPMELKPEQILPFIPEGAEIDQEKDARVSSLMKMVAECTMTHAAATQLLETEEWDFAAIYYDALDHFSHGFMKFRPPRQANVSDFDFRIFQHVVSTAYIYHDMMLARLLELAGEDCTVVLISDHGFHPDHLRPKALPSEPAGPAIEHRDYGIFVVHGAGIKKDHLIHGANLLDVTPTLLTLFGLPVGDDMDGQPLIEIFETTPRVETVPSWEEIEGNDGRHPKDMVIDPVESKAALDQLVALGYIEPPGEDSDLAIGKVVRELDYNLARAWMDAGRHGEAIPLLEKLYQQFPLEFRFGVQLANCLRATDRTNDLKRLVQHLRIHWRAASREARKRMEEVAAVTQERKKNWDEMKKIDDKNSAEGGNRTRLARVTAQGQPLLFDEAEIHAIHQVRAIARGNPQTLDFLAATIASAEGDFAKALKLLELAELTESSDPGFQYQVGNVYLGLRRYKDAERAFARGLEFDEFHSNCLMGLCRTCLRLGKKRQALEFGRAAVGLSFHFPVAHYFLARARGRCGDYEGAIASLHTAIGQNPNFVEAHRLLAQIYSRWHRNEHLARQHKARAQELAQENKQAFATAAPIKLPDLDEATIRDHLPKIFHQSRQEDEFVVCLAQPRLSQPPQDDESSGGDGKPIILVSGLPRSGTSLMMQMLAAAGFDLFTDENRPADESNPKGYFESELVKQLARRNRWILECQGKVVKVVAPLIPYLPQQGNYQVVYMERDMEEIIPSQTAMLRRLEKKGGDIEPRALAEAYSRSAGFALNLLALFKHPLLRIRYREMIAKPGETARQLTEFFGMNLDVRAMAAAVDPLLYRERRCPPRSDEPGRI